MTEILNAPGLIKRAVDEADGSSDDEPGPSPLTLLIGSECWNALPGAGEAVLRAHEACAERLGGIAGREVTVLLSTDAAVAQLNARYRGKNTPTNVLSFPAAAGRANSSVFPPLGDIIIAYETVTREAVEESKSPQSHLAHMTVHGILHLAGFDHETEHDAGHMESVERDILASMGIPDPYSTTPEEEPASLAADRK
jgi:probable rRNA maturation factor